MDWKKIHEELQTPIEIGPGIEGQVTTLAAPLQIEGTVDGKLFYFRARWNGWVFGIGDNPVSTAFGEAPGFRCEGTYGSALEASSMPPNVASTIIRRCVEIFRSETEMDV